MTSSEPHKCRNPHCKTLVPAHMLGCHWDWFRLPLQMRRDIRDQYDKQPGTMGHLHAVGVAIEWWRANP